MDSLKPTLIDNHHLINTFMKKSLLALLALSVLFVGSCGDKNDDPKPEVKDPAQLVVPTKAYDAAKGDGTIEIPISANYSSIKVSIASDATSWLYSNGTKSETKAEMKDYTVSIGYRANPLAKIREGLVTITLDELSEVIKITQAAGDPTISVAEETRKVNPRGQEFDITVTSNDEVNVTPGANWISLKSSSDNVFTLAVTLNDTGEPREGEVVFSAKTDANVKATLNLTQKAANVDPEAISILALGNEASKDALAYLYPVLQELGYAPAKIHLGNLYSGNTTLEQHASLLVSDAEDAYKYDYIKEGEWVSTDTLAVKILEPEDWDFIVLQQTPALAGQAASVSGSLAGVVGAVREVCPFVPLAWNLTQAFRAGSTVSGFDVYANDQDEMFSSIVDVVRNNVLANGEIETVIPVGTAVQNLRTSFFEDNITRDDVNLSYNIGREVAALTWAQALTGKSVSGVTYLYDVETDGKHLYRYENEYLPAIKEAVAAAIGSPYAVTASKDFAPLKTAVPNSELRAAAVAEGYDLSQYVEQELTIVHNAYYQSTASAASSTSSSASPSVLHAAFNGFVNDANLDVFAASHILGKAQLPIGTLIVLKEGYQFRPEGWTALSTVTATRPDVVKDKVTVVTDSWSSFAYRAFNLNKLDGEGKNATLTAEQMSELDSCISIFIPKTALAVGGDLEDYGNGVWNW